MSKFLAGALVGLVAGLLLAPDKGENTRDILASSAEKWRDRFNQLVGRSGAQVDDLRAYLDQDFNGLSNDVKNRILTILDEAEEMSYSSGTGRATVGNGVA